MLLIPFSIVLYRAIVLQIRGLETGQAIVSSFAGQFAFRIKPNRM